MATRKARCRTLIAAAAALSASVSASLIEAGDFCWTAPKAPCIDRRACFGYHATRWRTWEEAGCVRESPTISSSYPGVALRPAPAPAPQSAAAGAKAPRAGAAPSPSTSPTTGVQSQSRGRLRLAAAVEDE